MKEWGRQELLLSCGSGIAGRKAVYLWTMDGSRLFIQEDILVA